MSNATTPGFPERDEYISVVETLPPNYLDGNAAPLLRAIEELRKSLMQEIVAIQLVKRVDPRDSDAVKQLAMDYEDYQESRDVSHDRTHCANIGRAMDALRPPDVPLSRADQKTIEELKRLMSFLRSADADFLIQSNSLISNAVEALVKMRTVLRYGDVAESNRLHEEFNAAVEGRVREVKNILKRMTEVSEDLIDRLA